jgi:uncharacterized membrane protein YhaH (DUF805 family)
MLQAFRRYADFSGRSTRTEFWLFIIFQWLVYFGLVLVALGLGFSVVDFTDGNAPVSDAAAAGVFGGFMLFIILGLLFFLGTLIPNLAVAARRMQDQDLPGWIGIILVVGGMVFTFPYLIMAVFGFISGTSGPNQFGPDPRADNQADIFT